MPGVTACLTGIAKFLLACLNVKGCLCNPAPTTGKGSAITAGNLEQQLNKAVAQNDSATEVDVSGFYCCYIWIAITPIPMKITELQAISKNCTRITFLLGTILAMVLANEYTCVFMDGRWDCPRVNTTNATFVPTSAPTMAPTTGGSYTGGSY